MNARERRAAGRQADRARIMSVQGTAALAHIQEEGFGRIVAQSARKMRRVFMPTGDCKKWIEEAVKAPRVWTAPVERSEMDTRVYLDRIAAKKGHR